jgi:long-subunit acyl-CoA synthetase (AMP-forming)
LSLEALQADGPADVAAAGPAGPQAVALLIATSGSTGQPKLIPLTHANLLARAYGTNTFCDHGADDVACNWLPFDHIGSLSDWHLRPLAAGSCMARVWSKVGSTPAIWGCCATGTWC